MTRRMLLTVLGLAVAVSALRADPESGPKAGEAVPPLKAFGVVGPVEGKTADFAAERKDAPTVYVFVQADEGGIPAGGRPAARFMKTLDDKIGDAAEKAAVVAVWLGDKAFDKHKDYLPRFQMSMKLEHTELVAFDGEKPGPTGWGINADAHVTVVVANNGKVVKSFGFASLNETDVRPVLAELRAAVKK